MNPMPLEEKKIKKLDIGQGWRGITFVNTEVLLEDMALKINEIIDFINQSKLLKGGRV